MKIFARCLNLLLPAVFFAAPARAQNVCPKGFPDFETVEKTFFSRYNPGGNYVSTQKKPEGYVIVLKSFSDYSKPETRMLFWSAAKNAFLSLPLELEIDAGPGEFLGRHDAAEFNRQPYYGYPGWYRDAIACLETRTSPTAEELNALARAYGRATSALFNRIEADSADILQLDIQNPRFSPEQLAEFNRRQAGELRAYERLMALQPGFETPVGPVATKYANEIVDRYLLLCVVGEEKRARAEVPRGLYTPFLRESAYNLLQSCPPNAILLTWGDSDTYPLLYLQLTENVRPDVLVANTSLLNAPVYNRYLARDTVFDAAPPARTLPQSFYDESPILYFWSATSPEAVSLSTYFGALRQNRYREISLDGLPAYELPFKKIAIPVQSLAGWEQVALPANLTGSDKTDTLRINFDNHATLETQTILDWLATNGWTRPICFAMTGQGWLLEPFDRHLVQQGLVYRLYPVSLPPLQTGAAEAPIDVETTWRLWRETFQWQSRDTITRYDGTPYEHVYFMTALRLANALRNSGDNARARVVLDDFCRFFPNERMTWDAGRAYIAQAYALTGDEKSAANVLTVLYDNYEQNQYDEVDRQYFELQSDWVLGIAEEYGLSEINKRHRRIFKN